MSLQSWLVIGSLDMAGEVAAASPLLSRWKHVACGTLDNVQLARLLVLLAGKGEEDLDQYLNALPAVASQVTDDAEAYVHLVRPKFVRLLASMAARDEAEPLEIAGQCGGASQLLPAIAALAQKASLQNLPLLLCLRFEPVG